MGVIDWLWAIVSLLLLIDYLAPPASPYLRVVDREWALVLRHQISLPLTI